MRTGLISLSLALSALLAGCGKDEPPETVWELPPRYLDGGKPEAMDMAKASLDQFLDLHANPPEGTSNYRVLVQKPSSAPEYKFNLVWVKDISPVEYGFVGEIEKYAGDIDKSAREGNSVSFTRDEIQDWSFIGPDGIYGSFVTRQELANSAEDGVNVGALQSRYRDLSDLGVE